MKRAVGVAAALVLVAGAVTALIRVAGDDGPGEGEARLRVEGLAEVIEADGERRDVTGTTTVVFGDQIDMVEGDATLELHRDGDLGLREGLGAADPTSLELGEIPVLEAGDLLVESTGPLTVEAGGTEVDINGGAARVSRFLGMAVASYRGGATLDSAGQVREVEALRQLEVGSLGNPARETPPFDYDPTDPWDRRFLGDAVAFGQRLEALAAGLSQNLGAGEEIDAAFLRTVLPPLDEDITFTDELVDPNRPAGETIVGASIAALGRSGSLLERWADVFDFRDEGALWGLVALDQGVNEEPVISAVEQAVGSSELAFTSPPPTSPPVSSPPGTSDPPDTTPTTDSTDPTTPPPTAPPPDGPPIVDLPPPADPIEDLIDGAFDDLLEP